MRDVFLYEGELDIQLDNRSLFVDGKAMTILALTGWGQDSDRARSRAAGCDGHLVKPVDLSELEKLLAELSPPG